jgi:hypothetical protein
MVTDDAQILAMKDLNGMPQLGHQQPPRRVLLDTCDDAANTGASCDGDLGSQLVSPRFAVQQFEVSRAIPATQIGGHPRWFARLVQTPDTHPRPQTDPLAENGIVR